MQKKNLSLYILLSLIFYSPLYSQNLHLEILGNNAQESQVIDSLGYLKTHRDFMSLVSELDSLQNRLNTVGYIENSKKTIKINDSTYQTTFQLKKRYTQVHIYYDSKLVPKSVLNLVSNEVFGSYFAIPIVRLEQALSFINSKQIEKGFPFSQLRLGNLKPAHGKTLTAELVVNSKDKKRYIDAIEIKGYEKFPKSFLKHYLKIKTKQTFDLEAIEHKTEDINNLPFAKQLKAPEVLFTKDSTVLYMYIDKTKSNSFDGFLGFSTNEQTNKLDFNGYLNLNLTNNLNYGESFSLVYKSTQGQQKTFKSHLTLPFLLGTAIGAEFQLHIFKQDSTFTTVDQVARLQYQINPNNKIFSGVKTLQSNNLLDNGSSVNIANYNSHFMTIGYELKKPQHLNLLFPINTNIYAETGFGKRTTQSIATKQTLLNLDAFKIFNLNPRNSVYLRANMVHLISKSYYDNELSRFGGINSIRGFEENSLLATSYELVNTEYRLQLSSALYINSIADVAFLENKINNIHDTLFGFGFGFGIRSKSGLLKLNYATGKSDNQKLKFSNSKVHLSFISNF